MTDPFKGKEWEEVAPGETKLGVTNNGPDPVQVSVSGVMVWVKCDDGEAHVQGFAELGGWE